MTTERRAPPPALGDIDLYLLGEGNTGACSRSWAPTA